ncbi:LysR family transcriptional regulator [Bacteriovorax stolpii]|uniref:LysR family transcriptional regulator n=1 Tax=Bacteriovorax stolpii TaxID=960 RepID=UPI00115A41F1|nr:LysR family transcriptional regulator [Bacteriovorax stolpii]QDK42285.1 LysR family transcriptional regulator [Bacteriovorax stolpii]
METIKWIQCILTFVRVSELGSFSKAASSLGISKSHVSKTIKALEDEVGIALFFRSTRKVQLTSTGEEFLKNCQSSLQNLEAARAELVAPSDKPRGLLRVTLAGVFGENYIAPVLIAMAKKYPELTIELNFDTRIVDLIAERYDVGIRIGELSNSSLFAQKIASRREYVCASPEYLKKHKKPHTLEALKDYNCLGGQNQWAFKQNGKSKSVTVSGNLKTNNPRVVLQAALDGLGIVRLPGSYVFSHIKDGTLIGLLEDYSEGKKDIWAVTPARNKQNLNVSTFINELKVFLSEGYSDVLF